jgi:hypothetical protein
MIGKVLIVFVVGGWGRGGGRGAYAWGIVSDIHGRRLGFIATALFTFFFGMLRYMALFS